MHTPAQKDPRFRNIQALIVKVTQRCNLNCNYCYENVSKTGSDMEIQTFINLVDKVMSNSIYSTIHFIFHGGEPTLLSNRWYEIAINYSNEKASQFNKRAVYSIQSNILAINDSKIDLFKRLKINVGVSTDGPLAINGSTLRGNDNITISNIRKLQAGGLKVGVLTTINHLNYDKFRFISDWLFYDLKINSFKANIAYSVGAGYNTQDLSDDKIVKAQTDIMDYMIDTKGEKILEKNLTMEITRFFEQDDSQNKISLCDDRVCGAGKRVFGVNLNGELLPCGRFEWNDNRHNLGRLTDDDILMPAFKNKVNSFHDLCNENWKDCTTCAAKKVCRYSCQAFIVRSKSHKNVECKPMQLKYNYFLRNRNNLLPIYEKIKSNQIIIAENMPFD